MMSHRKGLMGSWSVFSKKRRKFKTFLYFGVRLQNPPDYATDASYIGAGGKLLDGNFLKN